MSMLKERKGVSRLLLGGVIAVLVSACSEPENHNTKATQHEFSREVQVRQQLTQVALGREPADTVIQRVTLLNVFTQEWIPDQDIVIAGKRIAWVGDHGTWSGETAAFYDAQGLWAVPGFGESHKHIESSYLTPEYEAALVIPHGNTWTVEGSHEISNVVGNKNAEFWLEAERQGSALKIFPAIGSATPPTVYESGGGYYGYNEMRDFMQYDPRVVALGEVMDWSAVINADNGGHQRIWEMIDATYAYRGVVEGHGMNLTTQTDISAFAAAGLSSDHEVRLAEEGVEKLRRGVFLEVKQVAMDTLFPALLEMGLTDWSNVSVTTDDRDVFATLQLGSMDFNIRRAIELGVPPVIAYQMGSYNTARHFHIEHLVGALAPGRYADVVLLDNPETVSIKSVFASGELAAENGEYTLPIQAITYPEWATDTMNVGRKLVAADFVVKAPEGRDTVQAAILEPFWFKPDFMVRELPVTEEGMVIANPQENLIKVAVVDRYHGNAAVSKMFWQGVGPSTPGSALASSQSHDLHNIWTMGNDDYAMALAANTVAEMGGGWVLVNNGNVVASVKLDIGGLMTARPVLEVAGEMEKLHLEADKMTWINGTGLPERMRFAFLTAAPWKWQLVAPYEGNPGGLVDVTTGNTHEVIWQVAFLNAYPWNALYSRLSVMMLLALLWSISAQAHLLNMTKVKASIDEDGKIEAVIDADLTKAAGGGETYFQLSQSATNNRALPDIIASLKAASVLRYETQALEWKVASINWPAAEYRDFVSGLAWPMTRITLISQLPAEFQQGELSFKFTGAFQFEEPIALSVVYLPTEQSLSRWLVRDQQSPRYTIQSGHASALPAGQVISRWLDYIWAGVVHILPYGWDHVLFVVGLWLGAVSLRQLMLWVTAFTAAHCVTLGLATYGAIVVPRTIVEPLIAISIAWIAIENILVKPGNWPRFIWVFGFGLLHGLGFAQVLRDIGLPLSGFFGTLVSFNIGVELAQIFILVCLMWVSRSWRHIPNSAARVKQFGSYGIAAIALVITAQRLLA